MKALKYRRKSGLQLMGMAYLMFLMLFCMAYTSPASFWDPVGIFCISLPLGLAIVLTVFIIRFWNDDRCGTSWALRLTFGEANEWIHSGRLDGDIRKALQHAGVFFTTDTLPRRFDLKTFGPVHKYETEEGPFVEWHRLTQSAFGGRFDMYVMTITVGAITSEARDLGWRIYEAIDQLELLKEARRQKEP